MGDGHHGWAAAEIVLAVRDTFLYEKEDQNLTGHDLVLLAGIPEHWFNDGMAFSINNAPIPGGRMTITASTSLGETSINIQFEKVGKDYSSGWYLRIPFFPIDISGDIGIPEKFPSENGETIVKLEPRSQDLKIHRSVPR